MVLIVAATFGFGLWFWLRSTTVKPSSYQKISPVNHISPALSTEPSVPTGDAQSDQPATTLHNYTLPASQGDTVPVIRQIATNEKVAFLTIDDGIVTNPADVKLMQAASTKATFFLVYRFIKNDSSFFANLAQATGSDIENHSFDHHLLPGLSFDVQKQDICQNADTLEQLFGKRPKLFRPSGGGYDTTTLHAAAACGMKALILWDASINNGVIRFQSGTKMRPGDIVLMHFRATFQEDLNAFVKAAQDADLQPDLLTNWMAP